MSPKQNSDVGTKLLIITNPNFGTINIFPPPLKCKKKAETKNFFFQKKFVKEECEKTIFICLMPFH